MARFPCRHAVPIAALAGAVLLPTGADARVVVVKAGAAPSQVSPRQPVTVPVTLRRAGRGGRVRPRLVLSRSTRAKGGTLLAGRAARVRVRRKRVVLVVRGELPATLPTGRSFRLLACADAARAVRGKARKRSCALARRKLRVPAGGAAAKIDAAVAAGRLSAARALQYKLSLLVGGGKVPASYRGPLGDISENGLIMQAASSFGSLPPGVRKQVLPLLLPPAARGSAWAPKVKAKRKKKKRRRARAAQGLQPNCSGHREYLEGPVRDSDGYLEGRWTSILTSDRNTRVHYVDWHRARPLPQYTDPAWAASWAVERTRENRAAALRFAAAMPGIWSKLSGAFGPPKSDAGEPCYHGPDGRFDVYVGSSVVNAILPGAPAVTRPYPAVGNFPIRGQFCTDRPAFMAVKSYVDTFTLAHEFMHAIQFAHRRLTCAEPVAFWDEGGANWAADFVYPSSQHEQTGSPHNLLINSTLERSPLQTTGYEWWPLWMMLHREQGNVDTLKGIFSAMRNAPAVAAVDQAVPGGWRKQLPNLLVHLYNQDPIGASGFPVSESFKAWDGWSGKPQNVPEPISFGLGGAAERTIPIKPRGAVGPLSLALIQRVTIDDDKLRELHFTNGAAGRPLATSAALRMADGNWKLEDWTQRAEASFCRDKPEEDVRELIVFSASVSQTSPVPFEHRLRGDDSCEAPFYRVLAARYTEDLGGSAFNEQSACGLSGVTTSFTERNQVSIGRQAFDPVNHLEQGPDGGYSGQIAASGPGTISGTLHGCDISAEPPFPPCTSDFGGETNTGPSIRVTIAKDSDTATVQWPLTNVGGNFPGADPACQTDPFRTSDNTEFIAEEQRPSSTFLADGPHTITLGKTRTGQVMGGQISSNLSYSLTFVRVNEDGSSR